jgi:DNA-binding NarL/FixJ family response regulator
MLIENDPEMEVVGEAANSGDALAIAAREKPDIILLDIDLGGETSLGFLQDLLVCSGGSRVLILTGVRDPQMHQRAIMLGAMGVVLKDQAGKVILKAIRKVNGGEAWIDREMMASVVGEVSRGKQPREADPEAKKIASLTDREREIIGLVSRGLANKDIAERLFIGEKTVRNNLTTIYSKLDVSNRLELALYASRHKLSN